MGDGVDDRANVGAGLVDLRVQHVFQVNWTVSSQPRALEIEDQHVLWSHLFETQTIRFHQDVATIGRTGANVPEGVVAMTAERQDAARPGDLLSQAGVDRRI